MIDGIFIKIIGYHRNQKKCLSFGIDNIKSSHLDNRRGIADPIGNDFRYFSLLECLYEREQVKHHRIDDQTVWVIWPAMHPIFHRYLPPDVTNNLKLSSFWPLTKSIEKNIDVISHSITCHNTDNGKII